VSIRPRAVTPKTGHRTAHEVKPTRASVVAGRRSAVGAVAGVAAVARAAHAVEALALVIGHGGAGPLADSGATLVAPVVPLQDAWKPKLAEPPVR
jgi:hypothetical protein